MLGGSFRLGLVGAVGIVLRVAIVGTLELMKNDKQWIGGQLFHNSLTNIISPIQSRNLSGFDEECWIGADSRGQLLSRRLYCQVFK